MDDKMVIVLSFDDLEDPARKQELISRVMKAVQPVMEEVTSRHVWLGVKESATAVLNVIGVD